MFLFRLWDCQATNQSQSQRLNPNRHCCLDLLHLDSRCLLEKRYHVTMIPGWLFYKTHVALLAARCCQWNIMILTIAEPINPSDIYQPLDMSGNTESPQMVTLINFNNTSLNFNHLIHWVFRCPIFRSTHLVTTAGPFGRSSTWLHRSGGRWCPPSFHWEFRPQASPATSNKGCPEVEVSRTPPQPPTYLQICVFLVVVLFFGIFLGYN